MSYRNEEEVMNRVKEHCKILLDEGYEVVFVAHQGSWNYKLGYEGSDVDTKAIILPSFEDIVYNREPKSFTKVLDNNEHIDVKDIRVMFENFKKQNINYLEILFSKFKSINPEYYNLIKPLFDNRELIAHFNKNQALRCMAGMSMEKLKALQHPYPSIVNKIEKYGYDPKQLHHILRMNDFIKRYGNGESFENCLIPKNPDYLIKIKSSYMPVKNAVELAEKTDADTKKYLDENLTETDIINQEVLYMLDDIKYQILKYKFMKDIKEN
jgi:predicted nucleotidyltransferase